MSKIFIEEQTFEKKDFCESPLEKGEYENCKFLQCNFSDADISGLTFSECEFISCNLSMSNVTKSAFRDVKFKECKMLGIHFDLCNAFQFSVQFENCVLNFCSFFKMNLKKKNFKHCSSGSR